MVFYKSLPYVISIGASTRATDKMTDDAYVPLSILTFTGIIEQGCWSISNYLIYDMNETVINEGTSIPL